MVTSLVDGTWMEVVVGGVPAANLRVDSYWHSGYVPIGNAVPEATPQARPIWVAGRYFPKFPESDRVYAIRVRAHFMTRTGPGSRVGESWSLGTR